MAIYRKYADIYLPSVPGGWPQHSNHRCAVTARTIIVTTQRVQGSRCRKLLVVPLGVGSRRDQTLHEQKHPLNGFQFLHGQTARRVVSTSPKDGRKTKPIHYVIVLYNPRNVAYHPSRVRYDQLCWPHERAGSHVLIWHVFWWVSIVLCGKLWRMDLRV